MTTALNPDQTAAFWARVVQPEDGCWTYQGYRDPDGYGIHTTSAPDGRRKKWRAHRLAWTLAHGPIPAGRLVLHRCDNPPCCRDDHLRLGTAKDNAADRDRPQRQAQLSEARHRRLGQHPLPGLTTLT